MDQVCYGDALQLIPLWAEGGHKLCLCSSFKPPENYPGMMHKPSPKPYLHRLHGKKKNSIGQRSKAGARKMEPEFYQS